MVDLDELDALAERQDLRAESSSDSSDAESVDADAVIDGNIGLIKFYAKRQGRQLDSLLSRYESGYTEPCDIIDIKTGSIVVDKGHLRSLPEPAMLVDVNDLDSDDNDEAGFVEATEPSSQRTIPLVNLYEDICQHPNSVLDRIVALLS